MIQNKRVDAALCAPVKVHLSGVTYTKNKIIALCAACDKCCMNCADWSGTPYVIDKERCSYTPRTEGHIYISTENTCLSQSMYDKIVQYERRRTARLKCTCPNC